MSTAALLLVVGPGLRVLVKAVILLVAGPRLTGGCVTKEVEGADTFLDFLELFAARCNALFFPFPTHQEGISHI